METPQPETGAEAPRIEHSFTIVENPETPEESPALALYQGPQKTGKTHALCTWPGLFVVNFEHNTQTLRSFPHVKFTTPDSPRHFEDEILPWILSGDMKRELPEILTVGFDNLSTWGTELELEVRGANDGRMEFDEWGHVLNRSVRVMSKFSAICNRQGLNVIGTVHEQTRDSKDKKGNIVVHSIGPKYPGAMRDSLGAYFDMILLPQKRNQVIGTGNNMKSVTVYRCRIQPDDPFRTSGGTIWGHRESDLPAVIDGTYEGLRKECKLAP